MISVLSDNFGQRVAQPSDSSQIFVSGIATAHARQNRIRSRLHRQMKMFAKFVEQLAKASINSRRKILRMGGGKANALKPSIAFTRLNSSAKLISPA